MAIGATNSVFARPVVWIVAGILVLSILILGFEEAALLKTNAEAALAGMVSAVGAAEPVGYVIVDFAVVDGCALPVKVKAAFVAAGPDRLPELIAGVIRGTDLKLLAGKLEAASPR